MRLRTINIFQLLGIIIPITVLTFLLVSSAINESPVFDEPLHITAGKIFWAKHDFREEPFNPPLARLITTLPIVIFPQLSTNNYFYSRLTVIFSTLILSLIVFALTRKFYGSRSAILALFIFAFETNILSHGHYATTDMISTTLIFLSLFLTLRWVKALNTKRILILAVVYGLTLSTKLTALFYLVSILGIIFFNLKPKLHLKQLIILGIVTLLALWSTYFFTFEPILGLRNDPNRPSAALAQKNPLINLALNVPVPLGSYASTIKQIMVYNYTNLYQKSPFLLGSFSTNGFWNYYPVALGIKTAPIILIFSILTISTFKRFTSTNRFLISIGVLIIGTALLSKFNLAIRYVLPLYPLLIIYSSQIANVRFNKLLKTSLISLFFVFYVFSTLKTFPFFITYANFLGAGSGNAYPIIVDSSVDWGQGLYALADFQSKSPQTIQLAYFGSVDPNSFGVDYERISDLNLSNPKPIVELDMQKTLVISETCWYYCGYYKHPLLKDRKPDRIIGGSLLVFHPKNTSMRQN